tara:strand:+ start:1501 stop:1806 length:306 start_codon:yes stop_codon:yes gene_type:complete
MSNETKDTKTSDMNKTHASESLTASELEELLNSKELGDAVRDGNHEEFVQKVVKDTGAYDAMDDANKKAADVMAKKGPNEAAKYMMSMAGGDYARMRSMYG